MTPFNIGLIVAGAILITAGLKGVTVRQVVKDSVGSVKGDKPIIIGANDSVKTPNTSGDPNIATGR